MRFSVEVRLLDAGAGAPAVPSLLMEIERQDAQLDPGTLGLTPEEGRHLLRSAQQALVAAQVSGWLRLRSTCPFCTFPYPHKDARSVTYRSVFGRVALPSPRWYKCSCADFRGGGRLRRSTWSPLTDALRERVSPHLERLQVEFAAHLPYARAVELLN